MPVRIVHQENNVLTYAPEPAFSVVLYINQKTDDEGNRAMKKVTEELIDLTIGLRVTEEQEREGLDTVSHGERAYNN